MVKARRLFLHPGLRCAGRNAHRPLALTGAGAGGLGLVWIAAFFTRIARSIGSQGIGLWLTGERGIA
jgi:hypothetical protein